MAWRSSDRDRRARDLWRWSLPLPTDDSTSDHDAVCVEVNLDGGADLRAGDVNN